MNNQKFLKDLDKNMAQKVTASDFGNLQSATLASVGKQLSDYISTVNHLNLSNQLTKIYSSLQINSADWLKVIDISSSVFENMKHIAVWNDSYSKQISSLTESLSLLGKLLVSDFAAMYLSAFNLSSLGIFDDLVRLHKFHKDSAEAFKSAGWTIAPSMNNEIKRKVVLLHQQNKTRYTSQVILGYYHKNSFEKLRSTVASWSTNPLFSSRMHIFRAALEAHCDRKYTLSVPALLPQIEGILNEYVKVNDLTAKLGKIDKVYSAVIGDLDEQPLSSWAIANTLLYQFQTNTYTFTDFDVEFKKTSNNRKTTRHTVLHGIATNYDKPVNSLKAFVLLDALSILQKPT